MNNDNAIVVGGCSYAIGIGCIDLINQPFGQLVANEFGCNLINLSRGGASNYAIYLQGLFAAEMQPPPRLVILCQTSYDRVEWVIDGRDPDATHSLLNLNYHQYPPFDAPPTHHHSAPLDFYLKHNPSYDPFILCEQIGGIDDYLKCLQKKSNTHIGYYERLRTESVTKLELIRDRYISSESFIIKKRRDIGLFVQAYYNLKNKGINCLLLVDDIEFYAKFIPISDIMQNRWGELSNRYPDIINSGHANEHGHKHLSNMVIGKIRQEKFL